MELHHDELYRYLRRMAGGSTSDAADLTQETWLRAWGAFDRLRPNSNVRAWLYRIATNCALSALRSARREVPLPEDLDVPDEARTALEQLEHGEELALVLEKVGALPPRQRAAVLLRFGHELRYSELACVLRCSEANARANVSLGVRRLRRELEEA
ncbi:MAG: RNA polymerase sigma factor [Anaerolineaceae bacterium]|nr:RNA polymerase sigma factor [Anaerolineaceae bacterium]MCY4024288.1 RNA polymerase sigma factor [Anaerolineaceae bacterium]